MIVKLFNSLRRQLAQVCVDLPLEPGLPVSRESEGFVVVRQRAQVMQPVDKLKDVVKFVLDRALILLRVSRVRFVSRLVQNVLLVEQEVLINPAEGLHRVIGALTVNVSAGLFVLAKLDQHNSVPVHVH
jgi:hypothetical protein